MKKTYKGSCHCGAVSYEANIDFAAAPKMQLRDVYEDAQLERDRQTGCLPPADGRRCAGRLPVGTKSAHHLFCRHCGVRPFGRGYIEQIGGHYVAVQVSTLDDIDAAELVAAPVKYANGRDNSWWTEPVETRHL